MSTAYARKKQPEIVRRALLDCAARLIADQGLASLTVQAVAAAAGVTKGGLFHHFPTKQVLVKAVFRDLLDRFDQEIDATLARDGTAYGCFTRAYIAMAFAEQNHDLSNPWSALSVSMITDPTLAHLWRAWLSARLARHQATDRGPMLEILRFAADGAWMALIHKTSQPDAVDFPALRTHLLSLTR